MMTNEEKKENVVAMIKDFGEMARGLKESNLKNNFKRFIVLLLSDNVSLLILLDGIEAQITKAQTTQHDDLVYNAKFTVRFWEKVKQMMIDTYQENTGKKDKEEDENG